MKEQVLTFLGAKEAQVGAFLQNELVGINLHDDKLPIDFQEITIESLKNIILPKKVSQLKIFWASELLLVETTVTVLAGITYRYEDAVVWDSEDKVLIPVGKTVSGERDLSLPIDISVSIETDSNKKPKYLKNLAIRDDKYSFIDLS